LTVATALAVLAIVMPKSDSFGVIITPLDTNYDIWVRENNPDTVYQDDAMWTSLSPSFDGGKARVGLVQFDLSSYAQPITSAAISLNYRTGVATNLAPSYWVSSANYSADLSAVTWNDYSANILPHETQFSTLGGGVFDATGVGIYHPLDFGSAADVSALESIRQAGGKVTVVFKATSGGRDWTANDTLSGFQPARLYLNELPPDVPALLLNVNRFTGATSIKSPARVSTFNIDGYSITSASGSLVPDPASTPGVGWDSIKDSGGAGWDELGNSANDLSEANLNTSTAVAAGASINLGKAFNVAGTKDVAFEYNLVGTGFLTGTVNYVGGLELHVNRLIGNGGAVEGTTVVMTNPESVGIAIDGYDITSANGSLDPANFHGFQDKGVERWEEVGLDANTLTELRLNGSSTVAANGAVILGSAFTTGASKDLIFEYHVADATETLIGPVTYVDVLSGDANGDKVVNIFDINLISSNWNSAGPNGDVNYDGIVNIFDINAVSSHWANTLPGGGGATAVPEPASCVLLSLGALAALARLPRRRKSA